MAYKPGVGEPGIASLEAALPAYEIGSELGRGAYGVVLAARHRQLGRPVAIKQLPRAFGADPGVRSRFLAEARVLAALDHPHIVDVYDFVDHDGICMLVMERLTGGTVWSRFENGGFTPDVSCAILIAVCAGLHHAHQQNVLHRDIKPENLMFSADGTLKVTDLGIAKVVGGSSTFASRVGEVLGTPAYMSPEQARGDELSPATDVYQAGTVLFELLAGRLPFPADSDAATILYRHVHQPPPPLLEVADRVPPSVASVVDRAIATSPADRYESAEAFGVAIATAAASAWGRGWLTRTNVPISASGRVLTAALGDDSPPRVPARATLTAPEPPPAKIEPSKEPTASTDQSAAPLPVAAPARPRTADTARPRPPARRTQQASRRRGVVVMAAAVVLLMVAGTVAVIAGGVKAPGGASASSAKVAPAEITNSWRPLPDAPTARQQVAGTVWSGMVWVLGGETDSGATATVEGYDPSIGDWRSAANLPIALQNAMAVTYRDDMVVIGGWTPNHAATDAVASNRVFALRNNAWVELPPLTHPRAAGAAAVVGDQIIVTGGQSNHRLVASTEVFDGTRWTDVAPLPTPRDHLAGATDGRYFYAVGGRSLTPNKDVSAVERYDPATFKWDKLPALPTSRSALGATIVNGRLITVGGETPARVSNAVEALDLTSKKWSSFSVMRTPRQGLAIVSSGSALFAIDGSGALGDTDARSTNEELDVPKHAASPGQSTPETAAPGVPTTPPQTVCLRADAHLLLGCSQAPPGGGPNGQSGQSVGGGGGPPPPPPPHRTTTTTAWTPTTPKITVPPTTSTDSTPPTTTK